MPIVGTIYEFGEKGNYEINSGTESESFNSFGVFNITGELVQTDNIGGVDVYTANSGNVD